MPSKKMPTRIQRLRTRMQQATEWAEKAQGESSHVAAATLLKAAEVFDEKLAVLEAEEAAKAHKASDDPLAILAEVADIIQGLPEGARESVLAQLEGRMH